MAKVLGSIIIVCFAIVAPVFGEDFTLSFEWGDIPLCTSGNPNTVPNPKFVLANVPEGTKVIRFSMTDLDVPSYNHGGGKVDYTGKNTIEPGAFQYKSPCPPGGSHSYRWTAVAKAGSGFFAKSLGKAEATRSYPSE